MDDQIILNSFFRAKTAYFGSPCFQVLEDLEAMVAFGGKNGAKNGHWTSQIRVTRINHDPNTKITRKGATSASRGGPP